MKRFFSKQKRRSSGSRVLIVLGVLAVYALVCWLYWGAEFGPGGKKTYLDVLLWNNVNIVFTRAFTDYVPTTWQGRALLMILIIFSLFVFSTIIGVVSSKINAYVNSPERRLKKCRC